MAGRLLMCGIAAAITGLLIHPAAAAEAPTKRAGCQSGQADSLPPRARVARRGSSFMQEITGISGKARDAAVMAELLSGNIPSFLRHLQPVSLSGVLSGGRRVSITICVTPDYLAVGSDDDFVRAPIGLPAAAALADRFGFLLPTTRMVDAIHAQAAVQLAPSPMEPTRQMGSTDYFWRHNRAVDAERTATGHPLDDLTAGHKKDIVLTNRLRAAPGRVAIYGWHRLDGRPIQPLSTVHGASYADYSHGVRLVAPIAIVDGVPYPLAEILQDPQLAPIVSNEGPIAAPLGLQASLHRNWPPADLAAASYPPVVR